MNKKIVAFVLSFGLLTSTVNFPILEHGSGLRKAINVLEGVGWLASSATLSLGSLGIFGKLIGSSRLATLESPAIASRPRTLVAFAVLKMGLAGFCAYMGYHDIKKNIC